MEDAFRQTEAAVLARAGECGTTAVCVLLIGGKMVVTNLGDSRAVLCRSEVRHAGGTRGARGEAREREGEWRSACWRARERAGARAGSC
eukprot:7002172-Prymnesium_polylepis.1